MQRAEDVSVLQPSVATALNGVDSLLVYYKDSTIEVQNLLRNECNVIYECR